ncbi:MAG: helix-turn-helix transcriptional regulator [Cyanobacteria bacterium J06633_8]
MTVISNLKTIRESQGLTQEQLARKANVSTSYIQKFEQNVLLRFSKEYIDKLCVTLNCDVGDLLKYENKI